jgi:dihydropteroate synthase
VAEVMGVLNVTPDSFSDGGAFLHPERAVLHAARMIDEGAAFIDIGGESTRPGAEPVGAEQECERVLPVVEAVAPLARTAGIRISVDTRNELTARRAVALGATLINDVGATLWPVAAELSVGWVAVHMQGDPRSMQRAPHYDDVVDEVRRFLVDLAGHALDEGVPEVWVDPGIGFGKTTEHNLELLAALDTLVAEGFDVLVGTSRKRFLGELLAESDRRVGGSDRIGSEPVPPDDRLDGSLATATWAFSAGARMVRAHDVRATVQAATVVAGDFPVR